MGKVVSYGSTSGHAFCHDPQPAVPSSRLRGRIKTVTHLVFAVREKGPNPCKTMRDCEMPTLERTVSEPSFGSLPEAAGRWKYFSISSLAQAFLLVMLARAPFSWVAPVLKPVDVRESVHLVAPDPTPPQTHDEPIAVQKPLPRPKISPKLQVKVPEVKPPTIEVPKVEIAKATPPTIPAPPLPKAPRKVVTPDFGSSAPVTLQKPPRQVQTGGFGDPNGVPANPNSPPGKGPMIAKLGSFDLPSGPGTGNGTGGATGARGTVASAGFGSGIAGPGQGGVGPSGGERKVQTTNFASADPGPPPDAPKRQAPTSPSRDTPVSLLSKPAPVYTAEARQKKIEGDVELDVEFTASGQVHVLRVVQGLGYGLDEAAVAAAQQIRFNPARRDGQPIDSHGRLRIVFRLS